MSTKPLFDSGWELRGIRSAEKFFSALTEILPLPANLCFEGTNISSDLQSLLASHAATQILQIPHGTILRGISIEVGGHINDRLWQGFWDFVFAFSNFLLAILFGAAAGNVARGAPVDGGYWQLVAPLSSR